MAGVMGSFRRRCRKRARDRMDSFAGVDGLDLVLFDLAEVLRYNGSFRLGVAMRIDRMPGAMNVLRFPVELRERPSVDLLRRLAPDVRKVLAVAEAFGLEAPELGLRGLVDAETTAHIAALVAPADASAVRTRLTEELLEPVLTAAIAACRRASDAAIASASLQEASGALEVFNVVRIESFQERSVVLREAAAQFMLEAHARCEEAEGVVRAVGFARRGDVWLPHDSNTAMQALCEGFSW